MEPIIYQEFESIIEADEVCEETPSVSPEKKVGYYDGDLSLYRLEDSDS